MILLQPTILNQQLTVFVRDQQDIYKATVTNQSTNEETEFDVDDTFLNEGALFFTLPVAPLKNTFYTIILRSEIGEVVSYYVAYCGTNTNQRYSRLKDEFALPAKDKVSFNIPDKT